MDDMEFEAVDIADLILRRREVV